MISMTKSEKYGIFVTVLTISLFFSVSFAEAQANFIDLFVYPSAGRTTDTYTFTVSWDTNVINSKFTTFNVKLQYKDSLKPLESDWKDYSGAISWDGPQYTDGSKKMKRDFNFVPSKIEEIKNLPSSFSGSYSFRIVDNSFDNFPKDIKTSTTARINFNNNCKRSTAFARAELVDGNGYTKTGRLDASVDVEQGNNAGRRTFLYDVTVQNLDVNCGDFSNFQFDVFETAPRDKSDSERKRSYSWKIVSVKNPDGSVTENPTTKIFPLRAGDPPTIFRLEVTAGSEIEPGVVPFSTITIRILNSDTLKETYTTKIDEIGRVTANTVRKCEQKKPDIRINPVSRSGYRGDVLSYLVSIYNENTGNCAPEDFYITKVGVLKIDQKLGDSHEVASVIPDTNTEKWKITQRVLKDNVIKDYEFNRGSGSFKYAGGSGSGDNYVSFTPRSTVHFLLGNSDDLEGGKCKACMKTIILKVESYSLDTNDGPRSVVVCVNKDNFCKAFVYNLVEPGQPKPADTGASIVVDSSLNDPNPPAVKTVGSGSSPTVVGGGGVVSGGGKDSSKPAIDPGFKADCRACTKQARKGLLIEGNSWKCVNGVAYGTANFNDQLKSWVPDHIGTVYKNNWIYVPTEASKIIIRDEGIRKSSYSCEKPPEGVGTSPKSTTSEPKSTTTSESSICSTKNSCKTCTPSISASCGWDKDAGVCKHGTSAGSDDGRATVSDGNWVWYTTKAKRGGKPGLSCEEI
jgi:hypothetical protein